jgi:hypothetical protein
LQPAKVAQGFGTVRLHLYVLIIAVARIPEQNASDVLACEGVTRRQ